jgi:hypothetical protein
MRLARTEQGRGGRSRFPQMSLQVTLKARQIPQFRLNPQSEIRNPKFHRLCPQPNKSSAITACFT